MAYLTTTYKHGQDITPNKKYPVVESYLSDDITIYCIYDDANYLIDTRLESIAHLHGEGVWELHEDEYLLITKE